MLHKDKQNLMKHSLFGGETLEREISRLFSQHQQSNRLALVACAHIHNSLGVCLQLRFPCKAGLAWLVPSWMRPASGMGTCCDGIPACDCLVFTRLTYE